MESDRTYLIATFGLSRLEAQVLETICIISRDRAHNYEMWSTEEPRRADVTIVDGDNPEAMAAWHRYEAGHREVPLIVISKQPADDQSPDYYQLARPIKATRLLEMLDEMQMTDGPPALTNEKGFEERRAHE